jgi:hypothetical protein
MDEGGVLFCTRTEVYFGVNRVGAAIWNLLPARGAERADGVDGLLDELVRLYPDAGRDVLAADLRDFLDELEKGELVAYASAGERSR